MDQETRNSLLQAWREWNPVRHEDVREVELDLISVLVPLLQEEGYVVGHGRDNERFGIDYFGEKEPADGMSGARMGIELKLGSARQGVAAVERVAAAAQLLPLDRLLLISPAGFTKDAAEFAQRQVPVRLELLDNGGLENWVRQVTSAEEPATSRVAAALVECSRQIALLVAEDARELNHVEWRDLERLLAAIFDELGFTVELTPSSKDKGKDIILRFTIKGSAKKFLVEVKHWRSGKRVGPGVVTDFVEVVANEKSEGGLVLSSSGFSPTALALTEVERRRVRLGDDEKVLSLCRTYRKYRQGLWSPPDALEDIVFAHTN